uniref:Uncharacterized protein n=1 Tax=Megaselia scalaris TaxID=36166 RepID=T1GPK2_MEGSC
MNIKFYSHPIIPKKIRTPPSETTKNQIAYSIARNFAATKDKVYRRWLHRKTRSSLKEYIKKEGGFKKEIRTGLHS